MVSTAHNPYCLGVTKLSLQSQSVKSALQTPDSLPMAWQALLQKSWLILHFDGIKALMLSVISQLSKKKQFTYLLVLFNLFVTWKQNKTTNSRIHQFTNLKCCKMSFKVFKMKKQGSTYFLK